MLYAWVLGRSNGEEAGGCSGGQRYKAGGRTCTAASTTNAKTRFPPIKPSHFLEMDREHPGHRHPSPTLRPPVLPSTDLLRACRPAHTHTHTLSLSLCLASKRSLNGFHRHASAAWGSNTRDPTSYAVILTPQAGIYRPASTYLVHRAAATPSARPAPATQAFRHSQAMSATNPPLQSGRARMETSHQPCKSPGSRQACNGPSSSLH